MADDLRNYKLQLQQVEGALLGDPDNEELLKLKIDLEELIELTQDVIGTPAGDSNVAPTHGLGIINGKGHNKEYLKKKKQKKQQRMKQYEEEREAGKNNWLNFHSKVIKKPGVKAKSIFASPDNLTGRVGVGTCGISGKPMTEFIVREKIKKGKPSLKV
ncbi:hypothetical protein SFRURICE_013153 [Spodoptera frugiperda]|nr:hypothetical protein SFRURICE_013153 [Spodoptera frugiperda]